MSTSRSDFNQTWLTEMPQAIGPIETFDAIEYNIKDLIKAGAKPTKVVDNLYKIELDTTLYYFYLIDQKIILGVELSKRPQGLTVNMLGKNKKWQGKAPWAADLYHLILQDHPGSIRLLSDQDLSDDGIKLWKKMIALGNKVSVYDRDNPGKTFKTFSTDNEIDQYIKPDDRDFRRYQFVLSESKNYLNVLAHFNTRRARELCGFSLED